MVNDDDDDWPEVIGEFVVRCSRLYLPTVA
jgi:hypothetical protein